MSGYVKITVPEAAKLMELSDLFVRVAMQRGVIDIGVAERMPGSSQYSYYVSPSRLAREMGVSVEYVFEEVRKLRCKKMETTA